MKRIGELVSCFLSGGERRNYCFLGRIAGQAKPFDSTLISGVEELPPKIPMFSATTLHLMRNRPCPDLAVKLTFNQYLARILPAFVMYSSYENAP